MRLSPVEELRALLDELRALLDADADRDMRAVHGSGWNDPERRGEWGHILGQDRYYKDAPITGEAVDKG